MLHLTPTHPDFPPILNELPQVPKELFIECVTDWHELMARPKLAVVGTRKVSTYGRSVTEQLVRAVASRGVVIVSGLALGTDSIAHEVALATGAQTIAILPSGLSYIYPRSHENLARRIVAGQGALLTEYAPHMTPRKYHFIARNRLIAALADAVLIPEAVEGSGSLHTARFALEIGHEVLAIPGPITSAQSVGTNNLIKSGARLVSSAQDIVDALGVKSTKSPQSSAAHSPEEAAIVQLLAQGLSDAEVLQPRSGLDATVFLQTLTMLEITGRVRALGNNHWTLS